MNTRGTILLIIPCVIGVTQDYLALRNTFSSISKLPFYADKTELLRLFFEDANDPPTTPFYFVTCPRRFGKTLNINMIKHFAEIKFSDFTLHEARENFKNTKIAQHPKIVTEHMNRYPVIHLELAGLGFGGSSATSVLEEIACRLHDSLNFFTWTDNLRPHFEKHGTAIDRQINMTEVEYIDAVISHKMTEAQLEHFLYIIVKMLYKCFKNTPVIVLVDEYDHAALSFMSERSFEHTHLVYQIINNMFRKAFTEAKEFIKFGLIVGVTSLSYSIDIELRSFIFHFPFLDDHPFTPYFGMTDEDVETIFQRYHCTQEEIKAIKEYYAPYRTRGKTNVYNTFSIVEYFKHRTSENPSLKFQFCSNWKSYEVRRELADFFTNKRFREKVIRLMEKRKIAGMVYKSYHPKSFDEFVYLRNQGYRNSEPEHSDLYFTLFFELGYLSHDNDEEATYCVPNVDVQEVYEELYHMFSEKNWQ